jgi:signal transduction histidine kinase
VHTGVLPVVAPLAVPVEEMSIPILLVLIGFMSFITFVPGLYIAIIVERLRRSEERLRARAAELVEAGRAKSEFTANITHELRTPLHGILGVGEILEEGVYGPLTSEQIDAVRTIRTSAHGLLELIDSLLVVARSEALKLEVRPQVVDLGDVIGSVVATGKLVVGSRALEIDSAVASDLPTVETDRQKLVQILVNLLANAIKFTPDRGKVRIEASREGDHVLVRVTDTGIGIAPEALDKIFEPFTQAEALELREHGGAGLGLYVVRTLSSLLRIDVDVESEVGRGSTFTLRVPPTLSASAAR